MKLVFCSCKWCKAGRDCSWNRAMIRTIKKGARHKVKQAIKKGDYDNLPVKIGVPYTD